MEGDFSAQVAGKAGGTGSQFSCFSMDHPSQMSPLFTLELNNVSF